MRILTTGLGTVFGLSLLAACSPPAPSGSLPQAASVFLPIHRDLGGGFGAVVGGKLVLADECLYFDGPDGLGLAIWPPGTQAWDVNNTVVIVDAGGKSVAAVGLEAHFAGGHVSDRSWIERLIGQPIHPRCQKGDYVLITELKPVSE